METTAPVPSFTSGWTKESNFGDRFRLSLFHRLISPARGAPETRRTKADLFF